jgi:methyl-accepting chemotaxis protein
MEANGEKEMAPKGGKKDYTFLDLIQDPAFVVDVDKKVLYANQGFADLVAKKREQTKGTQIDSLIKAEESGVDYVLDTGDTAHVLTWAMIKDKKYFLEFKPTPLLDEKGSIIGAIETIKDITGQKLALQAVQDLVVKAKAGELSARANVKVDGEYKLLVDGVNEMLDAILLPIGEGNRILKQVSDGKIDELITQTYKGDHENMKQAINNVATVLQGLQKELMRLTQASREGQLSERGKAEQFRGAYAGIVGGVNEMLDAILLPIGEGNRILRLIRGGNLREKVEINCKGDHQAMKDAVNGVHAWLTSLVAYVAKIAKGDMTADMEKASNDDQIYEWLVLMKKNIVALVADANGLARDAVEGKLSTRADVAKHQGEFRKVVEGVNATLDAILMPIKEASDCLQEMAKGNLDVEIRGDYKGDHAVTKESLNATLVSLNDILNQVSMAVDQVTTGARQVSDSSQSLSQAATESASSLEEITASMHELTSQTNMNAENALQASQLAMQARQSAEKGDKEMGPWSKPWLTSTSQRPASPRSSRPSTRSPFRPTSWP